MAYAVVVRGIVPHCGAAPRLIVVHWRNCTSGDWSTFPDNQNQFIYPTQSSPANTFVIFPATAIVGVRLAFHDRAIPARGVGPSRQCFDNGGGNMDNASTPPFLRKQWRMSA